MALTFPGSPTDGQIVAMDSGISYIYRTDIQVWEVFSPAYGSVKQEFRYLSTAAQVIFSGNDLDGKPLAYDVGFIDVFVEGIKLVPTEFTATDGTSVSITVGVLVGKDVQIVATGTFSAANHYTTTEQDALLTLKTDVVDFEKNLSMIPMSSVVAGALAVSDTTNSLTFDSVIYTGNGTSQSIVTGINSCDFTVAGNGSGYYLDRTTFEVKTDIGGVVASGSTDWQTYDDTSGETPRGVSKVHIKDRDVANFHIVCDGLRGVGKNIYTNDTDFEGSNTEMVPAFLFNGFTVGNSNTVNTLNDNYVAYQTLYTHITWGTTNHGKFFIEAYNPVTNDTMIMYEGSSVTGHEIPQSVGVPLSMVICKSLTDGADGWSVNYDGIYGESFLNLNTDAGLTANTVQVTSVNDTSSTLGTGGYVNVNNVPYIMYGKANSKTWKLVEYTGTGAAGNYVECGFKPARILIKAVSAVEDWHIRDNKRAENLELQLNTSLAEFTHADVDFLINGFNLDGSTATNYDGVQYIALVEADTNSDGGGSYEDLPTLNSTVKGNDLNIAFSNGFDANGAVNTNVLLSGETIIPNAVFNDGDGLYYMKYKEALAEFEATKDMPVFGTPTTRTVAGYNPDVYIGGKHYSTSNGVEKVINGELLIDLTGWEAYASSTISHIGQAIKGVSSGVSNACFKTVANLTMVDGTKYTLRFRIVNIVNSTVVQVYNGTNFIYPSTLHSVGDLVEHTFTATEDGFLGFMGAGASAELTIDNISVFETNIELDAELPAQTYMNNSIEVVDGKPVDLHEFVVPDLVLGKVVLNEIVSNGDVEAKGEFIGKNACTAWAYFDATTTPITILESFNVLDIVEISTGFFELYPEVNFDNTNWALSGSVGANARMLSEQSNARTVEKVLFTAYDYLANPVSVSKNSIIIFGGKN